MEPGRTATAVLSVLKEWDKYCVDGEGFPAMEDAIEELRDAVAATLAYDLEDRA